MGEFPYRAMPHPPPPPRAWRQLVRRGLVVFNGLAVALLLVGAMVSEMSPPTPLYPRPHGFFLAENGALALPSVLALFGFRGRAWRCLLTLPSAALWLVFALVLARFAVWECGAFEDEIYSQARHVPSSPWLPVREGSLAFLFASVACLTVDSAVARRRRLEPASLQRTLANTPRGHS